jgi:CheY-like chemotaxis protein
LHANKLTAKCRLIALTGYGQAHDRARSAAGGFEHHLVKPVSIDMLLKIVAGDGLAATDEAAAFL